MMYQCIYINKLYTVDLCLNAFAYGYLFTHIYIYAYISIVYLAATVPLTTRLPQPSVDSVFGSRQEPFKFGSFEAWIWPGAH